MKTTHMNIQIVVIDGQNDFCDIPNAPWHPPSTLPVPGAVGDMKRASKMIDRLGKRIYDIHCTMDSHQKFAIFHPMFWVDQNLRHPQPFTLISRSDVQSRIWVPKHQSFYTRALAYVTALEATGKFALVIWPEHCLMGRWGHNIQEDLDSSLQRWCDDNYAMVDYVTKGTNPWTEHYGALRAEVPDPNDPNSMLNTKFLTTLGKADIIGFCGEASSHCDRQTLQQIIDAKVGNEYLRKIHLLMDCMSSVPAIPGADFPAMTKDFFKSMERDHGMTLTTSEEFLK